MSPLSADEAALSALNDMLGKRVMVDVLVGGAWAGTIGVLYCDEPSILAGEGATITYHVGWEEGREGFSLDLYEASQVTLHWDEGPVFAVHYEIGRVVIRAADGE